MRDSVRVTTALTVARFLPKLPAHVALGHCLTVWFQSLHHPARRTKAFGTSKFWPAECCEIKLRNFTNSCHQDSTTNLHQCLVITLNFNAIAREFHEKPGSDRVGFSPMRPDHAQKFLFTGYFQANRININIRNGQTRESLEKSETWQVCISHEEPTTAHRRLEWLMHNLAQDSYGCTSCSTPTYFNNIKAKDETF